MDALDGLVDCPHARAIPLPERVSRPAARLLVVDEEQRVLMFRFEPKRGPLAGKPFWATPGGALEPGETFEAAAHRELREETGLVVPDLGPPVASRQTSFALQSGQIADADERYFVIRVNHLEISSTHWTEEEREFMTSYHWWTKAELALATEPVWPETLARILASVGIWT